MRNTGDIKQVQMDTMKDFVIQRIQFLSQKASASGMSPQFNGAAGGRSVGDDLGMMGGFVMDMIIWDALMDVGDLMLMDAGLTDEPVIATSFNTAAVAVIEGYSLLQDGDIYNFRSRRVNDYYPDGRKPMQQINDPKLQKRFNPVANQNFAPSYNEEAELMALMDIMAKLEALDNAHIQTLTFEKGKNAYKTITDLHKRVIKGRGVDMMMGGLRAVV